MSNLYNYKNYNNYKTIKPINIQLVLDSGAFSGSYILGGLLYIKQLEKNNIVSVQKISGSSVGSLLAFLYFTDKLNIVSKYFKTIKNHFLKKAIYPFLKKFLKKLLTPFLFLISPLLMTNYLSLFLMLIYPNKLFYLHSIKNSFKFFA